jgi:predicted porin
MKQRVSLQVVLAIAASGGLARSVRAQPAPPPPPPEAPTPLVEIYGTLVPFLEYGHTTGATAPGTLGGASQVPAYSGANAPARFRIDVGTSNLGFRGGLELTDDVSVIWQIESGVPIDGATVANTIASRNTHVGIKSKLGGSLILGSWDTPYKWAALTTINPIAAGFIPDYTGILSGPGFGVPVVTTQPGRANSAADAAFERRQGNSLQYWSPMVHGLTLRLAYSIDEGRTLATPTAPSIKPSLVSTWLGYDNGPLRLRYTYEAHFDYFGMSQLGGSPGATLTNRSSTDQGHRVIAQYTHAAPGFNSRLVGVFEYLSYKNRDTTPNAVDEHTRAAYYALLDQTLFAKHHIWLAYGLALDGSCAIVSGAACSTNGLGAAEAVAGYVYRVSKDTDFYAAAYRIFNKASASYSTFPPLGGPAAPGADVEAFGIGMLYTFSAAITRNTHRAPPAPIAPIAPPAPEPAAPPPSPPGEPAPASAPAPPPAP